MTGRPSLYTEPLAERICEELMAGNSLRKICEADDMPDRVTVIRWMGKDEAFATKCARARDEQADLMDDRILDVVNKCEDGKLDPHVAKVVMSGLQWRAMKLKPKKYGDKVSAELTGPNGDPLAGVNSDQKMLDTALKIAFILQQGLKVRGLTLDHALRGKKDDVESTGQATDGPPSGG
jgi:hypothetical protein